MIPIRLYAQWMRSCMSHVQIISTVKRLRPRVSWGLKTICAVVMFIRRRIQKNHIIHTAYVKRDASCFRWLHTSVQPMILSGCCYTMSECNLCVTADDLHRNTCILQHTVPILLHLSVGLFCVSNKNMVVWHILNGNEALKATVTTFKKSRLVLQIICSFVHSAAYNNAIEVICFVHIHKNIHRP